MPSSLAQAASAVGGADGAGAASTRRTLDAADRSVVSSAPSVAGAAASIASGDAARRAARTPPKRKAKPPVTVINDTFEPGFRKEMEKVRIVQGKTRPPGVQGRKEEGPRPRIKTAGNGMLFGKEYRRGEILAWHRKRLGRDTAYSRVAPTEDPESKRERLRAEWWGRKNVAYGPLKLETLPTTEANFADPPNLRWGDEEEAQAVDASEDVKAAWALESEKRKQATLVTLAEEALTDACDAEDEARILACLEDARAVGCAPDSKAVVVAEFTLQDIERRKEAQVTADLRARGKAEREATQDYLWTVRTHLGRCTRAVDPLASLRADAAGIDLAPPSAKAVDCAPSAPQAQKPDEVRAMRDDRGNWFVVSRQAHVVEKNGYPIRTTSYINHVPQRKEKPPRWVIWGGSVRHT